MTIPITLAQLVALFLESVFYGLYLITCWFSGQKLLRSPDLARWKRLGEINWIVFGVGAYLFTNGTANLAFALHRAIMAFVYRYDTPGGPLAFYTKVSDWVNIAITATLVFQTLAGDALLIYRCFIVFNKSWLVILLPCALWCGSLYAIIKQAIIGISLKTVALISSNELALYHSAFWAMTIAQNIISTGLIVYRVWSVENGLRRPGGTNRLLPVRSSSLMRVISIIVESGLLITTFAFMTFVCILSKSNGFYVTASTGVMIVGISFNLILIRSVDRPATVYGMSTVPAISVNPVTELTQSYELGDTHTRASDHEPEPEKRSDMV